MKKLKYSCIFCSTPTNFKSNIVGLLPQPYCIDCYAKLETAKKPNLGIVNNPAPAPYKIGVGLPGTVINVPSPYRPYTITSGQAFDINKLKGGQAGVIISKKASSLCSNNTSLMIVKRR